MNNIMNALRKLKLLAGRPRFRRELDEEMDFHRAERQRELEAAGMSAKQARSAAAREFGNLEQLKERSTEAVGFRFETVAQDLRFALRQLRRNPGFAATAVVILALGVGASVAIFAFVDAALIKPLPYNDPTRLVEAEERGKNFPRSPLSHADFLDWERTNTVFQSMAAFTNGDFSIKTSSGTEPVTALRVSSEFFRTLGVHPILGRDFRLGDDVANGPKLTLLSYPAWKNRFGGRKDVVGQSVRLSGDPFTIIGVLPESFAFALGGNAEFWTPLQPLPGCDERRSCHNLDAIARLKDGITIAQAQAEIQTIAERLQQQYPDSNRGQDASVIALSDAIVGNIRPILLTLMGGAAMLLLIALVNVNGLLLVRFASRRREIAVRGALGASRARLLRLFVTEGLGLAFAGSAAGLALAYGGIQALTRLISKEMAEGMPYLRGLGLTPHVWFFALALGLLAAMLFSVTPALSATPSRISEGLNEGGRGSAGMLWRRMGANLVVVELAAAVVLLTGAGLLGKSLFQLLHVTLGFEPDHVATINLGLPQAQFPTNAAILQFFHQAVTQAETLPGVQSVGLTSVLPLSCNCNTDWIRFAGKPYNGIHNEVNQREVSTGFFKTFQTKLLRGRYFTESEDEKKPAVIVINESFAHKYYPGEDPVGKIVGDTQMTPASLRTIVGVIADIKDASADDEQWPSEYFPSNQQPDNYIAMAVRTTQDEAAILPQLSAAIHKLNPDVSIGSPSTMRQRIEESQTAYIHRTSAWLVGGFAAVALVLAVVGLYSVIAYSVAQRTREIGVRMALGAQRGSVYAMVMKEAGWLIVIAIALGLIASVGAATLMRKLLFGTAAWDGATLAGVALILGAAAMLASFLPARRAAGVNPVEALRAE